MKKNLYATQKNKMGKRSLALAMAASMVVPAIGAEVQAEDVMAEDVAVSTEVSVEDETVSEDNVEVEVAEETVVVDEAEEAVDETVSEDNVEVEVAEETVVVDEAEEAVDEEAVAPVSTTSETPVAYVTTASDVDYVNSYDKHYTVDINMMNAAGTAASMCDAAFIGEADVYTVGDKAYIQLYTISPLPKYPDYDPAMTGTAITYSGTSYLASVGADKVDKIATIESDFFGVVEGTEYQCIVLTFEVPIAAIDEASLVVSANIRPISMDQTFSMVMGDKTEVVAPNQELADGTYAVPVRLLKTGSNEASHGDPVFDTYRNAVVTKAGDEITITFCADELEIPGQNGKVTDITSGGGKITNIDKTDVAGTTLTKFVLTTDKAYDEFDITMDVNNAGTGAIVHNDIPARLVFDWSKKASTYTVAAPTKSSEAVNGISVETITVVDSVVGGKQYAEGDTVEVSVKLSGTATNATSSNILKLTGTDISEEVEIKNLAETQVMSFTMPARNVSELEVEIVEIVKYTFGNGGNEVDLLPGTYSLANAKLLTKGDDGDYTVSSSYLNSAYKTALVVTDEGDATLEVTLKPVMEYSGFQLSYVSGIGGATAKVENEITGRPEVWSIALSDITANEVELTMKTSVVGGAESEAIDAKLTLDYTDLYQAEAVRTQTNFGASSVVLAAGRYDVPVALYSGIGVDGNALTSVSSVSSTIVESKLVVAADGTAHLELEIEAEDRAAFGVTYLADLKMYPNDKYSSVEVTRSTVKTHFAAAGTPVIGETYTVQVPVIDKTMNGAYVEYSTYGTGSYSGYDHTGFLFVDYAFIETGFASEPTIGTDGSKEDPLKNAGEYTVPVSVTNLSSGNGPSAVVTDLSGMLETSEATVESDGNKTYTFTVDLSTFELTDSKTNEVATAGIKRVTTTDSNVTIQTDSIEYGELDGEQIISKFVFEADQTKNEYAFTFEVEGVAYDDFTTELVFDWDNVVSNNGGLEDYDDSGVNSIVKKNGTYKVYTKLYHETNNTLSAVDSMLDDARESVVTTKNGVYTVVVEVGAASMAGVTAGMISVTSTVAEISDIEYRDDETISKFTLTTDTLAEDYMITFTVPYSETYIATHKARLTFDWENATAVTTSSGGSSSSGGGSSSGSSNSTTSSSSSSDTSTTDADSSFVPTVTPSTSTDSTTAPTTVVNTPIVAPATVVDVVDTVVTVDEATGNTIKTTEYSNGAEVVQTVTSSGSVSAEISGITNKTEMVIPLEQAPSITDVVVIVYDDGTREIIKDTAILGNGLRIVLDSDAKIEIVDNAKTFNDVVAGSWYEESVAFATSRELFVGMEDGRFAPTGTMSRAMIWQVLYNYQGSETATSGTEWYAPAQAWATEFGVSDGANPNSEMTREQLVTLLYRMGGTGATTGQIDSFGDSKNVSDWASDAMNWAVAEGILAGSNGNLNPTSNASRAEVSAIMMRFISK